jgi:DNA-binding NarL/FixJ family response regulator
MSGKTIKILLVDDHTMFRQGLLYLLHGQPHLTVVGEAADGQAALELARAHKPDL